MALLVWLPLNGTFKNKGILDITVTASGSATFTTGGKISELTLQGNGSTYWSINPITLSSEASICCWSKTTANGKMMWVIEATSSTVLNLYTNTIYSLNTGDGNNNPFVDNDGNNVTRFIDDKWHHFVVTFGNNQAKLYIDGEYKGKARAFKNPTTTTSKKIKIGGGYNGGHSYDWNGMINDFRVYNHCLSPLEVKEIALGLILHYKLDENINNNLINVFPAITAMSTWPSSSPKATKSVGSSTDPEYIYNYPLKTVSYYFGPTDDSADNSYVIYYSTPAEASTLIRSMLFIIKELNGVPITNSVCWPSWNNRDTTGPESLKWTRIIPLRNNFYLCLMDGLKLTSNALVSIGCNKGYRIYVSEAWCENDKQMCSNPPIDLFLQDQIIDSSGYNHHGLIVGTVETFATNSGKYNNCLYINSNNFSNNTTDEYYISADCGLTAPSNISVSWWSYPEKSYNSSTTIINGMWCTTANNIASDYLVSAFNHRDSVFDVNASDGTHITLPTSSTVVTGSEWHHYVVTYDGQTAKFYKDTILQSSVAFTEPKTLGNFTKILIGHSRAGGVHRKVKGKYSDFRVYATTLDDNDIKNLYNVSMKMDNLNNIHTFKIEELNLYSRELIADELLYTPYSSTTTPWTGYNENGEIYMTGTCSLSTRKTILINPSGNSFYYDFTISANVGNYIFLLFSRYDTDYTLRTNDATISVYAGKLAASINHKRIQGIVDLSTDGENPCKYIRFRAFCGYNGYEGDNPYLIIHSMSLREAKAVQALKILKNGIFLTDTITEDIGNILFKKLGMTYANEFIEI